MLKFYKDTKIYVYCPSGVVTGGAELLHQLVSYIRKHGREAHIVYFGDAPHKVPSDYSVYDVSIAESVIDNNHNIEVFYEGIFNFVTRYSQTQKFLWWISVDNFFTTSQGYISPCDLYRFDKHLGRKWGWKWLKRSIKHRHNCFKDLLSIRKLVDMDIVCGYQAEYIQHFLINAGFREILPLKDYINTDYFTQIDKSKKEDMILYNPSKGYEFTKQLIDLAPDLNWIPLKGFSRAQLLEIMRRAKLYIDFGFHPGKDRLPRECAMSGCCVITGLRGSAGFFEDVPLLKNYKFDEKTTDKTIIIEQIKATLRDYETAVDDFKFYREAILAEKEEFEGQMCKVFELC